MSVHVQPPSASEAIDVVKDNFDISVSEVSPSPPPSERFLVQSPYTEQDHLLDLTRLDHENILLAKALTKMDKIRQDYATAPYKESFNWPVVIEELKRLVNESGKGFKETSFYVVAFRSQIKPETDYSHLGALDKDAHAEAIASGGFLK